MQYSSLLWYISVFTYKRSKVRPRNLASLTVSSDRARIWAKSSDLMASMVAGHAYNPLLCETDSDCEGREGEWKWS